jgi:hypothetical protein
VSSKASGSSTAGPGEGAAGPTAAGGQAGTKL